MSGDDPRERDECFCCDEVFLVTQLTDEGFCTMCADARLSYNRDGLPCGMPCCRAALSALRKQGRKA